MQSLGGRSQGGGKTIQGTAKEKRRDGSVRHSFIPDAKRN